MSKSLKDKQPRVYVKKEYERGKTVVMWGLRIIQDDAHTADCIESDVKRENNVYIRGK